MIGVKIEVVTNKEVDLKKAFLMYSLFEMKIEILKTESIHLQWLGQLEL